MLNPRLAALLGAVVSIVSIAAPFAACGGKIEPGPCGDPPPSCESSTSCTTATVACVDGVWQCNFGPDCCMGQAVLFCDPSTGTIAPSCCPAGAHCSPVPTYCDLGGGRCALGSCPLEDAGSTCTKSIDATKYDQSCASDADCRSVYSGDLCGICECPNAAINQSAAAQYEADREAQHPAGNACDCVNLPFASCVAGRCSSGRP